MRNLQTLRTRFAVAGLGGLSEALRQVLGPEVGRASEAVTDTLARTDPRIEARRPVVRSPVSRQA
ncbi:hypothetical protein AFCDBAGC_4770 [Methylobacterium cerastii]|uniref:Uncharacterized protein n=1 Tax=Methylobacterium cerastii TaxID=932741 RepID=A0ABQ4QQ00_9HYPH|nr:hypothetical protein AFCDBAGC_4770 [Methylobacterium cerastii]